MCFDISAHLERSGGAESFGDLHVPGGGEELTRGIDRRSCWLMMRNNPPGSARCQYMFIPIKEYCRINFAAPGS